MKQQNLDPVVVVSLRVNSGWNTGTAYAGLIFTHGCSRLLPHQPTELFTTSKMPLNLRTVGVTPPPCACCETTEFILERTGALRRLKMLGQGGVDGVDPLRSCRIKHTHKNARANTVTTVARHEAPCVLTVAGRLMLVIPPGQTFAFE